MIVEQILWSFLFLFFFRAVEREVEFLIESFSAEYRCLRMWWMFVRLELKSGYKKGYMEIKNLIYRKDFKIFILSVSIVN